MSIIAKLYQAAAAQREDIDSEPIPELVTVEQAQRAIEEGKKNLKNNS